MTPHSATHERDNGAARQRNGRRSRGHLFEDGSPAASHLAGLEDAVEGGLVEHGHAEGLGLGEL